MITKLLRSTQCGRKKLRLSFLILLAGIFSNTAVFADGTPPFGGASADGTSANPYEISTAEQLAAISSEDGIYLGKYFKLTADITLSLSGEGWTPIGTSGAPFTGHFDGGGYTISGLWINRTTTDGVGLFGYTGPADPDEYVSGSIKNLNVVIGDQGIKGKDNVGGLVGRNEGCIIDYCSVSGGNVEGVDNVGGLVGINEYNDSYCYAFIRFNHADVEVSGEARIGGLVGYNHSGSAIEDSYATGKVTGGKYVGGLVGYVDGGNIFRSYATGDVTGDASAVESDGGRWVGGLVGTNYSVTIFLCFATGNVTGDNTEIGGLVGQNEGGLAAVFDWNVGDEGEWVNVWRHALIDNSYATGAVSGASQVGGLVGWNNDQITNSYATGKVTGASFSSGLVGNNDTDDGHVAITASYFDKETSEITAPLDIAAFGKSTAQLKNKAALTTAGWTFSTSAWQIRETPGKSYPYLYWQSAPAVITEAVAAGVEINLAEAAKVDAYVGDALKSTDAIVSVGNTTYTGTFEIGATVTITTTAADKAPSYPVTGKIGQPEIIDVKPTGEVATARLGDDLVLTFNREVTGAANKLITISVTETSAEPATATIYGYATSAELTSAEATEDDKTVYKVTIPFDDFVEYELNSADPPVLVQKESGDELEIATGNTYKLSVEGGAFESEAAIGDPIPTPESAEDDPLFTFTAGLAELLDSDFTVSGNEYTYDGTAKTATVTPKDGVGTPTVSYYTTSDPSVAVESPTNAGTYDIKVTVAENDDYEAAEGLKVGTLTINKVTLTGTDLEFTPAGPVTYDGDEHGVTVSIAAEPTNIATGDALAALGTITVYYTIGEGDEAVTLGEGDAPVDAGEYTITVEITESANYTTPVDGLEFSSKFTINKATLAEENISTFLDFELPASANYSGNPQGVDVDFKTGITNAGEALTVTYYSDASTELDGEPTDAGTYTVKVSLEGEGQNFEATTAALELGTLTISKVTLDESNISTFLDFDLPASADYSGTPQGVEVEFEEGITNAGGTLTVTYYSDASTALDEEPTNAGTYTVKVSLGDDGQNFNATAEALELGTLTISKVTLDESNISTFLDFDLPASADYSGTPQGVEVEFADDITNEGGTLTVTYYSDASTELDEEPTNAGTYTVKVSLTGDGQNFEATTTAFELGTLTINKVILATTDFAITPESPVTYDGTAKTVTVSIADEAASIVAGDDLGDITVSYTIVVGEGADAVTLDEAPVDAGTYTITVEVESDNYATPDGGLQFAFTINKATPTEVVFPTIAPFAYAENKTLSSVTLASSVGGDFTWKTPDETITVGEKAYDAIFTQTDFDNYDYSNVTEGEWDEETPSFTLEGTITLTMAAYVPPTETPEEPGGEEPGGEEPGGEEEPEVILPTGVSLNQSSITLKTGDTQQLAPVVRPLSADNKSVSWTSSNTAVATVSSNGVVTAVAAGTATITVTTVVGGYKATCTVTVEERNFVVETPKPAGNKGVVEVSLNLPADGSFSCTFTITLPQGFVLDQSVTALADDLKADYLLGITLQTGNTWQFDIRLKSSQDLRAATTYRNLVDVAYTIEESLPSGNHEVKLTNLELTMSDNTVIREDEIIVSVTTGTPVGIAKASESVAIRSEAGKLYVTSPAAETVYIYSFNGKLLYTATKATGKAVFDAPSEKLLIVRGTSGWARKVSN